MRGNLASLLADTQRYGEAESMFRDIHTRCLSALGEGTWLSLEMGYQLARVEALQGNHDDALTTLGPVIEAGHVSQERMDDDDGWDGLREHPNYLSLISSL